MIFVNEHFYSSPKCYSKGLQVPNIQNVFPVSNIPQHLLGLEIQSQEYMNLQL